MNASLQESVSHPDALKTLWELTCLVRAADDAKELSFLLTNETRALVHYRQAAFFIKEQGVHTLSGVVQIESNAPYVQWLNSVFEFAEFQADTTFQLCAADLPEKIGKQWADWWPAHAIFCTMKHGAIVSFVRDEPWEKSEIALLNQWTSAWSHAFFIKHQPRIASLHSVRRRVVEAFSSQPGSVWWRRPAFIAVGLLLCLMCIPVRLSVLAQGELVPANPVVVRSPLDGVVDVFHIKPNSSVQQGEPLFGFDEVLIKSRLDLAQQTLQTAETDYRQTAQMALVDSKYKSQLALMMGKIEEKRAELYFLAEQLNRARVVAPQAGVVLMDDPSEWIGRPISVGERILRIASQNDMEVEAWLPLADAITLEPGSGVTLYLNSSPLSPVQASVRYVAHDAVQRPEGHYAYRVRATLTEPSQHRVGLKGTAKLSGGWVLAGYWIFRRPLATLRAYTGF